VEPDKGGFDFGFGHFVRLEVKYLNRPVGSAYFAIYPSARGSNQLVSADTECSPFCPTLTIGPATRQASIPSFSSIILP
jgi:hypothetical protein